LAEGESNARGGMRGARKKVLDEAAWAGYAVI
jgi:hypothetical protein